MIFFYLYHDYSLTDEQTCIDLNVNSCKSYQLYTSKPVQRWNVSVVEQLKSKTKACPSVNRRQESLLLGSAFCKKKESRHFKHLLMLLLALPPDILRAHVTLTELEVWESLASVAQTAQPGKISYVCLYGRDSTAVFHIVLLAPSGNLQHLAILVSAWQKFNIHLYI